MYVILFSPPELIHSPSSNEFALPHSFVSYCTFRSRLSQNLMAKKRTNGDSEKWDFHLGSFIPFLSFAQFFFSLLLSQLYLHECRDQFSLFILFRIFFFLLSSSLRNTHTERRQVMDIAEVKSTWYEEFLHLTFGRWVTDAISSVQKLHLQVKQGEKEKKSKAILISILSRTHLTFIPDWQQSIPYFDVQFSSTFIQRGRRKRRTFLFLFLFHSPSFKQQQHLEGKKIDDKWFLKMTSESEKKTFSIQGKGERTGTKKEWKEMDQLLDHRASKVYSSSKSIRSSISLSSFFSFSFPSFVA